MNTVFENITVPTLCSRGSETAKINGKLPLPRQSKRIAMTDGSVAITSTETSNGKINCKGKLMLNIICEDSEAKLYSFSASADFSHELECPNADMGMHTFITAQLTEIKTELAGDDLIVNAEAEMIYRVEDESGKRMLKSGEDVEIQTKTFEYKTRECVGQSTSRLREDIAANNIESVIYVDANALVRDITAVIDTARVDGILNMNALCYDKNGEYVWLKQNIPFTADVEMQYDNCTELSCHVDVSETRLRLTEDEYGLATLDAQLSVKLFSASTVSAELTGDAFCPTVPFSCEKTDLQLLLYKETTEQKGVCRDTLPIKSVENLSSCVFCSARPFVSSATKGEGCIILDGTVLTNMIYMTKSGELSLAADALPFSISIPMEYNNAEIDARPVCTAINAGTTNDHGIELSIGIHLTVDIYELCDTKIVSDTKKAECTECAKGFVVCFAAEGETLYDIAKQFNVSQKSLLASNPELKEKLSVGDKAIVLA